MISNEERREVAERLRSASARRGDAPWMVEDLMLALGFRCYEDGEDQLFNRLADLIDRPTCKNSEYLYDGSFFECSECGERWELSCGSPADNNLNFCPRCGAEVVS